MQGSIVHNVVYESYPYHSTHTQDPKFVALLGALLPVLFIGAGVSLRPEWCTGASSDFTGGVNSPTARPP